MVAKSSNSSGDNGFHNSDVGKNNNRV
ncbi:unnamed protein product, partial [Rotaria sp. Silwood2]